MKRRVRRYMGDIGPTTGSFRPMNALSPDRMTPAERLGEIGRLLALAILRARQRRQSENPSKINTNGEVSLDFADRSRRHGGRKTPRRESP